MDKGPLMIIGAHCGDGEIQAGAIARKYARNGHQVIFLHLTAGEKGNPPNMTAEQYRKQKIQEAEKAAAILGATSITLDYKDAELNADRGIIEEVSSLIREHRPKTVITHWTQSIHRDHKLCAKIVKEAQLMAGLPGFDLNGLSPHYFSYYHSENWEDMEGYEPDLYIDVSEDFEIYLEALSSYWFIVNSKAFRYFDYYKALGTVRGCLQRTSYSQTLKFPNGTNIRKEREIPGLPL